MKVLLPPMHPMPPSPLRPATTIPTTMRTLPWILTAASFSAHAHPGHGLGGAHWHATDAFGFIAGLAAVGAVLWWRGRK